MSTELFSLLIDNEYIHGIIHHPGDFLESRTNRKHIIIFLHGFGGYRIGPHRMFVEFSEKLAEHGYTCVRFDFRGWGYSGAPGAPKDFKDMISDIDIVIDYLKAKFTDNIEISLMGICSGAKQALYYTKERTTPIKNLILLSSSALNHHNISRAASISQVRHSIKPYVSKLFRKETWQKFIAGEIRYKNIWDVISRPLQGFTRGHSKTSAAAPPAPDYSNLTGPVILIHAGNDPETVIAKPQIEQLLERNNKQFESHIIKDANHSFYSMPWKEEIYTIIENGLK